MTGRVKARRRSLDILEGKARLSYSDLHINTDRRRTGPEIKSM